MIISCTYDTSNLTGMIISELCQHVVYFVETDWGWYDETYIFSYGYATAEQAYKAYKRYFATINAR